MRVAAVLGFCLPQSIHRKIGTYFVNYSCMNGYIPRLLEEKLAASLQNRKVLFLLGARQVGKTTLVENLLQNCQGALLNMDIEVDRARLRSAAKLAPAEAMQNLGAEDVLVIDEAQRIDEIGQVVKGWYDAKVETKIILLGSASDVLLKTAAAELTGRNEKLWLTPLLFQEVLAQQEWYSDNLAPAQLLADFPQQLQSLLLERLVFGSYPEALQTNEPADYLTNLSSDYLLKDLFTGSLIRSPEDVRRLLLELAQELGTTISVAQLASRLSLARQTVTRYLELLQNIFVIFELPAYYTDSFAEINKSSKYYFWDTGVKNALQREWTVSAQRSDMAALWENWVLAELLKKQRTAGSHHELFFWRSRNDSSVDLVEKDGSTITPYDIRLDGHGYTPSRSFATAYDKVPHVLTPETALELLLT